ncbi:MAG TPA: potassium transporter Kup [Burkholderiaceae bacterium]
MNRTAKQTGTASLVLGALGVVFGDIGTSPLYALHDGFNTEHHPIPVSPENVLGLLSLVVWALIIVVSLKYVVFIMSADNKGEGGIIALMALALRRQAQDSRMRKLIMALAIFGAALFYGDGVITPAISVISAIEGLEVATPGLKDYVVPITMAVLSLLFYVERRGTATVGKLFGPVMVVWFLAIGIIGAGSLVKHPGVLAAVDPRHGIAFILRDPVVGFFSLGTVVLVLTGVEALYADMGHFGRHPIRIAWYGLVLPALLLCYFGQGALILESPSAISNPFYLLAPSWALYPLVGLSTVATIIASQAVISGAYSMTQQAMQLGYAPRMNILQTSAEHRGQIYLSGINWVLYIAVMLLVWGFRSSANLAAAYGIAVSGTMLITTMLAYVVVTTLWKWSVPKALAVIVPLTLIDLAIFCANAVKIEDGGWFPLAFGFVIFVLMTTWKKGRMQLHRSVKEQGLGLSGFLDSLHGCERVQGTAVYLTGRIDNVPLTLLHSLKHFKVLHERVIIVSVRVADVPRVGSEERATVEALPQNFWRVRLKYGFMDEIDVPAALESCDGLGLPIEMMDTTFLVGREKIDSSDCRSMTTLRARLFAFMQRNAEPATSFFRLPPNRVIEIGSKISI